MGRSQKRPIVEHLQNAVEKNDWEGFCSRLLEAKKGYGDDVIEWAVSRTYDPTYIVQHTDVLDLKKQMGFI